MAAADADPAELSEGLRRHGVQEGSDSETASDDSDSASEVDVNAVESRSAADSVSDAADSDSDEDDADADGNALKQPREGLDPAASGGASLKEDATLQALKASVHAGNGHGAADGVGSDVESSGDEEEGKEEEP